MARSDFVAPPESASSGALSRADGLALGRSTPVSAGGLACTVVTDPAAAHRLRPVWVGLLKRSACPELPMSPEWLLAWWQVYGGWQGEAITSDSQMYVVLAAKRSSSTAEHTEALR